MTVEVLKESGAPKNVSRELINALKFYFAEDSYPTRMRRLAADVSTAVPRCIGEIAQWKNGIRDLRVGLAHSLGSNGDNADETLWQMVSKVRSLRWALLIRMLQEAGVDDETLGDAVTSSEDFIRDESLWRRELPGVYPKASNSENSGDL